MELAIVPNAVNVTNNPRGSFVGMVESDADPLPTDEANVHVHSNDVGIHVLQEVT